MIRIEVTAAGDQPASITAFASGPELANSAQEIRLHPIAGPRIGTRAAFSVVATAAV
ncbi:hypothetical protein GCM10027167_65710 [Nocardia heshunensis]